MKMGAGLFWGILLILIGLGIVIRVVFNIDFPLIKFIIAFFFIFIGIKILIGNYSFLHTEAGEDTTIFSESKVQGQDESFKEYNVIFGSTIIDLRDIDLTKGSKEIKINTIFGSSIIKLDEKTAIKVKADAAFASAKLPNGTTAAFGTGYFENESFQKDTNHIYIKGDVVFGSLEIKSY
ncbi:MAG TPA: LiaF domain-containing protein [Bacteroidales bacterium]|nr:LiaF domain-containing protein [Bacteroidales bacterium]